MDRPWRAYLLAAAAVRAAMPKTFLHFKSSGCFAFPYFSFIFEAY
jgi:hypothetical protein